MAEQNDFLVIGAGIAGLRAALTLAESGRVLLVTKEALGESNTQYAQGGIAVAMSGEEDVSLHLQDTKAAGDGLVQEEAARVLAEEGPLRVEELLRWGTNFDRYAEGAKRGELMLTREGAHSRNRILHANGDATGREIGRALLARAQAVKNIRAVAWSMITDLAVEDGRVCGAALLDREGRRAVVTARAVLLASGGAGQVYRDTTNPPVATGDGIAAAARAGAELADMEFYQFHPTALNLPGVQRFLLSEALRGEGAYLRNARGERFMERYHPLLELAPRDVVARAITRESFGQRPGEVLPVYLDMRHVRGLDLAARFPGISGFLHAHGLALQDDLIPVTPAAHYLMGGVRTDVHGRTTLPGLYAAGEVACTGVHGANRLASNSLLEGLVFGARAAETMLEEKDGAASEDRTLSPMQQTEFPRIEAFISRLQRTMWQHAGLLRDRTPLENADLGGFHEAIAGASEPAWTRRVHEAYALHGVAAAIVASALAREESRGAHFRNDFPQRDDARFQKHSLLTGDGVRFGDL
ncbi:MAG: L-aspartate oxidase [Acidobacteriaceae bacterium]